MSILSHRSFDGDLYSAGGRVENFEGMPDISSFDISIQVLSVGSQPVFIYGSSSRFIADGWPMQPHQHHRFANVFEIDFAGFDDEVNWNDLLLLSDQIYLNSQGRVLPDPHLITVKDGYIYAKNGEVFPREWITLREVDYKGNKYQIPDEISSLLISSLCGKVRYKDIPVRMKEIRKIIESEDVYGWDPRIDFIIRTYAKVVNNTPGGFINVLFSTFLATMSPKSIREFLRRNNQYKPFLTGDPRGI